MVRIILQARTTSSRLPAKVLLPIGGVPMAILCARRLGRGGTDLVLATSSDRSDDELAQSAHAAGIRIVRGPLDDVMQRFVLASQDMADEDILIRATADNPVADHEVVDIMLADFRAAKTEYLGMSAYDGVPYGAAVEIFSVGAFRAMASLATSAEAKEHVTPLLARQSSAMVADRRKLDPGIGPVRVTVDTLDDYLVAARAFRSFDSAIETSWDTAVRRIHSIRSEGR